MKDKLTEALARYLNEIIQTETHFDDCSKKIQDAYRSKAGWILEWLASRPESGSVRVSVPSVFQVLNEMAYKVQGKPVDQIRDIIDQVEALLTTAQPMDGWVRVSERLPEDGKMVLVSRGWEPFIATWNEGSNCWDDSDGDDYWKDLEYFRYWRPLPTPPRS